MRYSNNSGKNWSSQKFLFKTSGGSLAIPILDSEGTVHIFHKGTLERNNDTVYLRKFSSSGSEIQDPVEVFPSTMETRLYEVTLNESFRIVASENKEIGGGKQLTIYDVSNSGETLRNQSYASENWYFNKIISITCTSGWVHIVWINRLELNRDWAIKELMFLSIYPNGTAEVKKSLTPSEKPSFTEDIYEMRNQLGQIYIVLCCISLASFALFCITQETKPLPNGTQQPGITEKLNSNRFHRIQLLVIGVFVSLWLIAKLDFLFIFWVFLMVEPMIITEEILFYNPKFAKSRLLHIIPLVWILMVFGLVSDLYYREGIESMLAVFCLIPFLFPLLLLTLPMMAHSRISQLGEITSTQSLRLKNIYYVRMIYLVVIWILICFLLALILAAGVD